MKITLFVTLAILLVLVVLAESSPARRRGRISRGRQAARNARGRFNNRRQLARRGRTGTHAAEADADAAAADAGAEGEEAEFDGPTWCNPEDPMGAWLLYKGVKLNCVDNGIEEFGRYGGIPAEDEDVPE